MELLSAELPKTCRIILAGDLHYGTAAASIKGFDEMLGRVEGERNTYLCLLGDLCESITVDDPRFNAEVSDGKLTPLLQAEHVADKLKPIAKKVLVSLTGNHCLKLYRYGDIMRYLCERAGIPYGGYSCKLDIRHKGRTMFKAFLTHGRLSVNSFADDPVRRLSNMRLSIKRKLSPLAGDCYLMACGHTHRLISSRPEYTLYMTDDGTHLKSHYTEGPQVGQYLHPDHRFYGNTGSFLRSSVVGATSYSEFACYAPLVLGYLEVVVQDGHLVSLDEKRIG